MFSASEQLKIADEINDKILDIYESYNVASMTPQMQTFLSMNEAVESMTRGILCILITSGLPNKEEKVREFKAKLDELVEKYVNLRLKEFDLKFGPGQR